MGFRNCASAALRACFAFAVLGALAPLGAETFRYTFNKGDKFRVLTRVHEDVYYDRVLSHRAEILDRIAAEVSAADARGGTLKATFQTSERAQGSGGRSFQWAEEYDSVFVQDALGRYTIAPEYWMPVVRDVPVFPEGDVKPGDSWTAAGEEVHDFRRSFDIAEPYRIPISASYTYLGERVPGVESPALEKGKAFPAFSVSYRIFEEPKRPASKPRVYPVRIMGASDQTVFWDRALGRAIAYAERFRMVFELSNGMTVEYRGDADAVVVESTPMDRGGLAGEIAADIKSMAIPDAAVRVTDEGVAINLEDIRFQADSAILLGSEKAKLDKIADILKKHPERDILVGGHTALAGSEEGRNKLSRDRAAAVADYLIGVGARAPERVVVRGYGATKPLGDNGTDEGKKKNRRVEITLLEN